MWFIAVSLGASLFVSLVLFEVLARIIESQRRDSPELRERLDLLTPNPNGTGSYRLKPDIDLVTPIGRRAVRIQSNRHGMHWREVAIRNNDGRRRIAFLGDSFTFGAFPQAYLQVFARDRDIPYLDLLPILRLHVSRTNERLFLAGDPHLNNRGHEIVGQRMADWFRCCVKNRKRLSKESTTRVTVPDES